MLIFSLPQTIKTRPVDSTATIVSALPRLACLADDIVRRSAPGLPGRSAHLLWVLQSCDWRDVNGTLYITTRELVQKFQKWFLIPIIGVLLLAGVFIVLGGTAVAPFIYALF